MKKRTMFRHNVINEASEEVAISLILQRRQTPKFAAKDLRRPWFWIEGDSAQSAARVLDRGGWSNSLKRNSFAVQAVVIPAMEASMEKQGDRVVETAVEARAGFLDRPVVLVLTVSCILAIVVLGLTYAGFFS
jgi:hypothetical protein